MFTEGTEAPAAAPGVGFCDRAINKARQVAGRALERLRGLAGDLPDGTVEQIERRLGACYLRLGPKSIEERDRNLELRIPVTVETGAEPEHL